MDWILMPQAQFACSKIFAGSIIINTINSHAIICNTVESCGRTNIIDPHREHFSIRKGSASETSLPPPFETPYANV
ncbi:hypothetical protein EDD21DRAFT_378746 [Dissophora ornata]|nr:hypothetical protein EDD21DRAFT_378746 [Dissophora ornata]